MTRLQRQLGLPAVFTVSLGAMIGSGIFVLPGLATDLAGPAAILAYFLAGIVVVPAALSKAEMTTAMPEAGGTYLFIDRAMGPLMGTVAGVGVWFALVFKSAFALVGLEGYMLFFLDVPARAIGVVLAVALIAINVAGVKQSGGLQTVIVTIVLGVLGYFLIAGGASIDGDAFRPFAPEGISGLLGATALVFVSYAGVTKVASVAEEVRRPGSTLPRGILGSMALMLFLYPALVWVIVGNVPLAELGDDPIPVATTAEQFMGRFGVGVISATAVLALVSMANAGLLSSSRYPFAMARRRLAPRFFARVAGRTGTPIVSVMSTGAVMVALIAAVPLIELAKLASAFQLLVFSMVNLSLMAYRESAPSWYRPEFRSPLYPWPQLFGIAASLLLLTQLGLIALLGAVGIVVGGVLWYRVFGRARANRESAALDAIRLRAAGRLVTTTEIALKSPGRDHVVILVRDSIGTGRLRDLLRIANAVAAEDGRITVARTDREVRGALWWRRQQLPRPDDPFRLGARDVADELGIDIAIVRPRGSDSRHAVLEYADRHAVDLILGELPGPDSRSRSAADLMWIQSHADSDVMLLGNQQLSHLDTVTVLGAGSPNDVAKIDIATRLALAEGSRVSLVHILGADANEAHFASIRDYHSQLAEISEATTESVIDQSSDLLEAISARVRGCDLVVLGASPGGIGAELSERIRQSVAAPVLTVHAPDRGQRTIVERTLQKLIY